MTTPYDFAAPAVLADAARNNISLHEAVERLNYELMGPPPYGDDRLYEDARRAGMLNHGERPAKHLFFSTPSGPDTSALDALFFHSHFHGADERARALPLGSRLGSSVIDMEASFDSRWNQVLLEAAIKQEQERQKYMRFWDGEDWRTTYLLGDYKGRSDLH